MSDSAAHNIGVVNDGCDELDVLCKFPKALIYNIHPLMMFQRVTKKLLSDINNLLGNAKIKDLFMVDINLTNESFIV